MENLFESIVLLFCSVGTGFIAVKSQDYIIVILTILFAFYSGIAYQKERIKNEN
jgi:hypothetical protein